MLTARRDPLLHPGEHDAAHSPHPGQAVHGPGFHRFMNVLQVAGSVLAIPLGLASGYSIYHANFSAEARCQGLRANIVSVLDKSADASTLRMLVRRDVADFESSCAAVDPDAVAAFKTLLATGKKAAPAAAAVPARALAHSSADPIAQAPKPAPAKAVEAKPVRVEAAKVEAAKVEAARADDAKWVASVRDALVHMPAEQADEPKAPAHPAAAARPQPSAHEPGAAKVPALSLAPPAASPVAEQPEAPALPAAKHVAAPPAPAAASDHPVPPGLIPPSASTK